MELGIYFYPKGQEPKYRQVLASFTGIAGGNRNIDIRPNSTWVSQNFHVMKQAGRVENFQPHMHLRGKAMSMEAILPNGRTMVLSHVNNFNFNWHLNYVYAAGCGAAAAARHHPANHRLVRQYVGQQEQSRSESVGWVRRPHGR